MSRGTLSCIVANGLIVTPSELGGAVRVSPGYGELVRRSLSVDWIGNTARSA